MHKRILTEESKRACGDEDKLFKERQKIVTSTFHKDKQSCHICKEKMEKVTKTGERVISSLNSGRSSQRKESNPRNKKFGKKKDSKE